MLGRDESLLAFCLSNIVISQRLFTITSTRLSAIYPPEEI